MQIFANLLALTYLHTLAYTIQTKLSSTDIPIVQFSGESTITFKRSCLDVELHNVKIKLTNTRPIFVTGIYRPPDGNMNKFSKALNDLLHSLGKQKLIFLLRGILISTILK